IAIYVHKSNPIDWVSTKFLAEIYGQKGFMDNWNKFGLSVPGCVNNKVQLIGRQVNSGTYVFFQESILGRDQDFKQEEDSIDVGNAEEVIEVVAKSPCAIGYSSLAHDNPNVKKLNISRGTGSSVVAATVENVINQSYPLARPLYIYSNGEPTGPLQEYLEWIKSDEGQCVAVQSGYAAIRPVNCPKP
uniref:substrate-binding domain-containing protein n=1 Tax=Candidatus Magnetaquicoccus inordinatus TaxID=2496818 RepID=UPI00187D5546